MCGEQSKKPSATDKGIFRRVKICEYMLFYIYIARDIREQFCFPDML